MSILTRHLVAVLAAGAGLCLASGGGCKPKSPAAAKMVVVMGFDGMEPALFERMMNEGRLPNFDLLRSQGGYQPLGTSIPPQSPVAWSNFITGAGPGEHGIFDFVHRKDHDPGQPYFSTDEVLPERWVVNLGQYRLPLRSGDLVLLRRSTPFWEHLDQRGISVYLYRIPANFPPTPSHGNAKCLSGMGVPDIQGTQGTYQYFAEDHYLPRQNVDGGIHFDLVMREGVAHGRILGPPNPFLEETPDTFVDFQVYCDRESRVAKIVYQIPSLISDGTQEVLLAEGEWSDWRPVVFPTIWFASDIPAQVRFYLRQVSPTLRLYVTPPNMDPFQPAQPFAEPLSFATDIAEHMGRYYTQGFAEDFKALKHGALNNDEFAEQAEFVLDERMKLLDYALEHYQEGFLYFYFSGTDLIAHQFYWEGDEPHPSRDPEEARRCTAVLEQAYELVDSALGKVMQQVGGKATIIAMSDHGFANFRREFGLNTWLRDNGYLALRHPGRMDNTAFWNTDWPRTKAYGLGLNGLYVNLAGREPQGIVAPGAEYDGLCDELAEKLLSIVDPASGKQVIRRVYRADQVYSGPYANSGPDLLIGYARDYRCSWATCLGSFDQELIHDNLDPWSADHCMAAELVPGILVTNRPVMRDSPALIDLAPTILAEYGIPKPDYMTGRDLFALPGSGVRR